MLRAIAGVDEGSWLEMNTWFLNSTVWPADILYFVEISRENEARVIISLRSLLTKLDKVQKDQQRTVVQLVWK